MSREQPTRVLRLPVDFVVRVAGADRVVRLTQDGSERMEIRFPGETGMEVVARFTPGTGDLELAGTLSQNVVF